MSRSQTYLDYNATAPARDEAIEAIAGVLRMPGNPSSIHKSGRKVRGAVDDARECLADLLGVSPQTLIFTSGGTEANGLALLGLAENARADAILISAIEHPSVVEVSKQAGVPVIEVEATSQGVVDIESLAKHMDAFERPIVSVMNANNETGIVQPTRAIADLVHARNGIFHSDAVQAFGKISIAETMSCADAVSISAHKIGGAAGCGVLYLKEGLELSPLFRGGGQEMGRRGGTENVTGIVGFAAAAKAALEHTQETETVRNLRDQLEARVAEQAPEAVFVGQHGARLPNTSFFAVPGLLAETTVAALDLEGVSISAGSACSSGKVQSSHVMTAMGFGPELASSAIRVSFGYRSQEVDVKHFMAAWTKHYDRVRSQSKDYTQTAPVAAQMGG